MDRSKVVLLGGMIAVARWPRATPPAQAMTLYSYDLDSLVYMSPKTVEGTLGGGPAPHQQFYLLGNQDFGRSQRGSETTLEVIR